MIPKLIHQTFETEGTPPDMSKARDSWRINNVEYEYCFYDDVGRIKFIKKHFTKKVLNAYHLLIPGSFKADLFRYCVLYIQGGVYVDCDMICLQPLSKLIEDADKLIVVRDDPMTKKWIAVGFLAAEPKHPVLWEAINRAVDNVIKQEEMFYLDYTGPGLFGKALNCVAGRDIETEYKLGDQYINSLKVKMLLHDFPNTKFKYNGVEVLHVEYPTYRQEMKAIDNHPFYHYIQTKNVFKKIPNTIIFTTYDSLDINDYMISSFKKHNPEYEIKHFSQNQVDLWFKHSIYNNAYLKLTERGERSDFFRYCYLWENGGVYVDADIYCNQPLRNWIKDQDLIVGLEADMDGADPFFKDIGVQVGGKILSVCNWAIATAPKQMPLNFVINDIINNPVNGVLQNTGPGRFSKHIISYFGASNKIKNSYLLPINAFGSNQNHSGAFKSDNPFSVERDDVFLTHMFAGTWRGNVKRKPIQLLAKEITPAVSHNITIHKTNYGYKGVARYDQDTSRTEFMKFIGESKSLVEYKFDESFNVTHKEIKEIKNTNDKKLKFEDYRAFTYLGLTYYCVAYLDEEFNTYMGVLDNNYNFKGKINIDRHHKIKFGVGKEVLWEKNWLFFESKNELYFIYATTPDLIIYKCDDFIKLEFNLFSSSVNYLSNRLPKDELYFSSNTSTGGSTNPVWIEALEAYVYLIHTKLYEKRSYNHFVVCLDSDLKLKALNPIPFISSHVGHGLMFVTTMIVSDDKCIICGGVEDNQNFIWEIPLARLAVC